MADEPLAWLGPDAGRVRVLAEIWATVDLERALADIRKGAVAVADPRAVLEDPLLGARVLLLPSDGEGRRIALAEPSTEGRLARTLARHGEGRVGSYLAAPVDLDVIQARAGAANIELSRPAIGPFGRSVLVLTPIVTGPHLILVERPAVPSPP